MHIVASIQARLGSTRLPGKVLFHLGDRRVLQWCIDRTTAAEAVDETIVTTGNRPENDAIKRYCERADTAYSVGPEENLLPLLKVYYFLRSLYDKRSRHLYQTIDDGFCCHAC
jgi:spore coat polysaccharide biosynthesis protein SpsF